MLAQDFQDELNYHGVFSVQAYGGAELMDGADDLVADSHLFGTPLIDGPNVVAVGFPCGGEDGQGFDSRVQGHLVPGVAAQAGQGVGGCRSVSHEAGYCLWNCRLLAF